MAVERTRGRHPETVDLLSTASEAHRSMLECVFLTNLLTAAIAVSCMWGSFGVYGKLAGAAPRDERLPVEGYDRLSVEEISRGPGPLDAAEVGRLKRYEGRHENRAALMERFDRSLVQGRQGR